MYRTSAMARVYLHETRHEEARSLYPSNPLRWPYWAALGAALVSMVIHFA